MFLELEVDRLCHQPATAALDPRRTLRRWNLKGYARAEIDTMVSKGVLYAEPAVDEIRREGATYV